VLLGEVLVVAVVLLVFAALFLWASRGPGERRGTVWGLRIGVVRLFVLGLAIVASLVVRLLD
jgi:hypothetical protein